MTDLAKLFAGMSLRSILRSIKEIDGVQSVELKLANGKKISEPEEKQTGGEEKEVVNE